MNILKAISEGATLVAEAYTSPRSYDRPANGCSKDRQQLRGDVVSVGNDMRKAVANYGESYTGKRS